MGTHSPGPVQGAVGRDRGSGRVTFLGRAQLVTVGQQGAEEPFAAHPPQHPQIGKGLLNPVCVTHQFPVLFPCLGEADTRVDDDPFPRDAYRHGCIHPGAELGDDVFDGVVVVNMRLHRR